MLWWRRGWWCSNNRWRMTSDGWSRRRALWWFTDRYQIDIHTQAVLFRIFLWSPGFGSYLCYLCSCHVCCCFDSSLKSAQFVYMCETVGCCWFSLSTCHIICSKLWKLRHQPYCIRNGKSLFRFLGKHIISFSSDSFEENKWNCRHKKVALIFLLSKSLSVYHYDHMGWISFPDLWTGSAVLDLSHQTRKRIQK